MSTEQQSEHNKKRGVDYIGVTCVFVCHDGNGRVLLSKRSNQCRDEQGTWDCGAGSMEHGETWEDTIRREVKEEYCVEPINIQFAAARNVLRDNNGTPTHWIALVHAVQVNPDEVRIGEPHKIDDIGWFRPDEFPEPLHSMVPTHFELVRKHLLD